MKPYLLFSCLAMSNEMRAMKHVICMKKSMSKAMPAYRAKARTAGMSDSAPRKKQVDSDTDERSMDGATSPTIRPTCSACVSVGLRGSRW